MFHHCESSRAASRSRRFQSSFRRWDRSRFRSSFPCAGGRTQNNSHTPSPMSCRSTPIRLARQSCCSNSKFVSNRSQQQPVSPADRRRIDSGFRNARAVVGVIVAALMVGCGRTSSADLVIVDASDNVVCELQVTPQMVDLGIVPAGSRREFFIEVQNTTGKRITVGSLHGSCECLRATVQRSALRAGESVRGRVAFDLIPIPEYVGRLDMSITAKGVDGDCQFQCRVLADDRPRSEFEGLGVDDLSTEQPGVESLRPIPDQVPSILRTGVTR